MWFIDFAGVFAFILVAGYLAPAGQCYFRYYVRKVAGSEYRIQDRQPPRGQVWREIRMSLVSVLIFAVIGTLLLWLYRAGHTGLYWDIHTYPLVYLPASLLLCMVLFDTYFYWSHRFMHWRPVFKYMHAGHHRSVTPTPWAIFAFQPLEALLQGVGIALLVIFLPLHPVVLLVFLWIDTVVNTAGHSGYELVPKSVSRSWLYSGFNTVRHHDSHHTNMKVNFGSFFNIWDRWMGTFMDDRAAAAATAPTKHAVPDAHKPADAPLHELEAEVESEEGPLRPDAWSRWRDGGPRHRPSARPVKKR